MSKFIGRRSRTNSQAPTPGEHPAVILRVQVVGCADLLASDSTGKSDPYVVVRLGGDKRKTPYIKQSLSPEYPASEATFDFNIYRSNMGYLGALECVVWDWDHIRDDYLGEVAIPVNEWFKHHEPSSALAFEDPRNKAFPTTLTSTRNDISAKGTIQLKIGFVSVYPMSPSDYAAILSELQHAVKIGGSTLRSSAPTRSNFVRESKTEDGGTSAGAGGSDDGREEGEMVEFPTTVRATTISAPPRSKKAAQPPLDAPSPPPRSRSFRTSFSPSSRERILSLGPNPPESTQGSRFESRADKRKSPLTNIHESDVNSLPNSDIVGIVMLEIQGAEGLPRWKNAIGIGMDMDPFCVISFGKKSFSTRVIRHSLDPNWNQKLLLHVHQQETEQEIRFTVFDFDKISKNDKIGSTSLALPSLMANGPKPDSEKTTPLGPVAPGEQDMAEYRLQVVPDDGCPRKIKSPPTLKFRANYQPYHALLQKLWSRCLDSHDTSGNRRISRSELKSLLAELGSTLSEETVDDFFTRFKVSPKKGDLTMDQVIACLQEKSMEQCGEGSSFNDIVERVIDINLQSCPVCRQPRAKGETDIMTHLAVCLSPDWAGADWMVGDDHVGSGEKRKATSSPHGSL